MPARAAAVLYLTLALSACANPYVRSPEAGISTASVYRAPKPSKLVVGNYCGVGSRTGDLSASPLDKIDAACLQHDACFIEGRSQLDCNREMKARLSDIIKDSGSSKKTRAKARTMIAFFSLPVFRIFPHGILPPRDPSVLANRYGAAENGLNAADGLY